MKQGQTGGKESVSLQHSVKFTGPLLPHKVQGLAGLAASTNTYFSTTINTVEETTAFSLFHTKETEVNRTVFVTLSILIIFHLDAFATDSLDDCGLDPLSVLSVRMGMGTRSSETSTTWAGIYSQYQLKL